MRFAVDERECNFAQEAEESASASQRMSSEWKESHRVEDSYHEVKGAYLAAENVRSQENSMDPSRNDSVNTQRKLAGIDVTGADYEETSSDEEWWKADFRRGSGF